MSTTAERTGGSGLRICLAGSGGGHVRQLLDLADVWRDEDYFFVTEDTALGQTLAGQHRTHFVPHYAWGQARLGGAFRMLAGAARNLIGSAAIMLRERPDLIVSTGAGAVFFAVLWGRLLGARVVAVESFARFDRPSLFGRIAAPIAHEFVVQSGKLKPFYPRARVFDPLRLIDGVAPAKRRLLFATVGATLPFDRLVSAVAELKAAGEITEEVIVQTGVGGLSPHGVETAETLSFDHVQDILREAAIVVCHGGTGSIITALREGCQVIAIPRLARLGEHYDDHQSEITEALAARGLILVANTPDELRAALIEARSRRPTMATTDPRELIAFLKDEISALADGKSARAA